MSSKPIHASSPNASNMKWALHFFLFGNLLPTWLQVRILCPIRIRIRNTGEKYVKDGCGTETVIAIRIIYQQCRNFRLCSKRTGFATRHALLQSSTPRKAQVRVRSQWNIFACSTAWITVNMDGVTKMERGNTKVNFLYRYRSVYNLCMVFLVGFIFTSKRTTEFSHFSCYCYDLRTTIKLTVKN